jgi:hypothetical protein
MARCTSCDKAYNKKNHIINGPLMAHFFLKSQDVSIIFAV